MRHLFVRLVILLGGGMAVIHAQDGFGAPATLGAYGTTSGAALTARVLAPVNGRPEISWTDLGAFYWYTVQERAALDHGQWMASRLTNQWPARITRWTLPAGGADSQFYRVLAMTNGPVARGTLLAATLLHDFSLADIAALSQSFGLEIASQYPVSVYKLTYATVDAWGVGTVASGAFAVPDGLTNALPLISYQHGTSMEKTDVPSALNTEANMGIAFGTTGYAVALPDYVGMGDSPGFHPYHHAKSEATAVVDMLRASRSFCAAHRILLNQQLFLCGYSQGGHVTMAAHRELEQNHADEFVITASAPMAGAYDLSGVTATDFLSGRQPPNPYYFAYLLAAYQTVYHLSDSLSNLLAAPYATTLPPLVDGRHSGGQINQAMPKIPTQALRADFLAAFRSNPNAPLWWALRDNDLYQWRPRSPLHLYHCHGDQDVIYANSETACQSFLQLGASQVQLIDPFPTANHSLGFIFCIGQAKTWFDSLRQ
jgi:hypothetical protein